MSKNGLNQGVHQAQDLVDAYQIKGFNGEVLDVAKLSKQAMEEGALKADGVMKNAVEIVEENKQMVGEKLDVVRSMTFAELIVYGRELAAESVNAAFPKDNGVEKSQESRSINQDLNTGIQNMYAKLAKALPRLVKPDFNVGKAMDEVEEEAKNMASELVEEQMDNGGRGIQQAFQVIQQQGWFKMKILIGSVSDLGLK